MAIKELTNWDLPDGHHEEKPVLSPMNLRAIIVKLNELIKAHNELEIDMPRSGHRR